MNIAVIVCTYNRCGVLAAALNSISLSRMPETVTWEILVIDNNSTDRTRQVVAVLSGHYPGRIRYVFEPKQGKSHALNRAIREATAEILVFTDDDVTVHPDWLRNLTAKLADPEWMGAGGRVLPIWGCTPPKWLALDWQYSLAPLAHFDLGSDPHELTASPIGANMAIRSSIFGKYGGFRTDLGPSSISDYRQWSRSGPPRTNEDTEFGERILAAGEKLWYAPSAIVYHAVDRNRLKKKYFLAWWFDKGRGDARQYGIRPNTRFFVFGVPLYLIRNLLVWAIRWAFEFRPKRRFQHKLFAWYRLGGISERYWCGSYPLAENDVTFDKFSRPAAAK